MHADVTLLLQDMYDDALSSGHGAYTGRSERPNVFTAVVGNLPPGGQATIHITYVTELGLERRSKADEAPQLRFILPARLAFKRKKNVQGYEYLGPSDVSHGLKVLTCVLSDTIPRSMISDPTSS